MMTPEQRYLLDATGYLNIKNPLSDEELSRAQEAADRYIIPRTFPRENSNRRYTMTANRAYS